MRDPKSTKTNIFYLLFGAVIIGLSVYHRRPLQCVGGVALMGLGMASMGYHSRATRFWHRADIIGIYGVFFVAFAWQLAQLSPTLFAWRWVLMGLSVGYTVAMGFTYERWSQMQIGLLAAINVSLLLVRVPWWHSAPALLALAIGLYYQRKGERHAYDAVYDNYHQRWHPLTAFAISLMLV